MCKFALFTACFTARYHSRCYADTLLARVYHQEEDMALPTQQQHQHFSQEPSSCSWTENSCTTNKRHSSVTPPQEVGVATRTGRDERRSPIYHQHRPDSPITPQYHHYHHLAATTTPTFAGTSFASAPNVGGSGGGPLSFPAPEFSAALKVVEADGSFTLISQATGRRWSTVNSTRDCQFGEVLRAVESTEEVDVEPSAYFAIKVFLGSAFFFVEGCARFFFIRCFSVCELRMTRVTVCREVHQDRIGRSQESQLKFALLLIHPCYPFHGALWMDMCALVVQELRLNKLREMQGRTHEDPLREVATLQYLAASEGHPNVLAYTEVGRRTVSFTTILSLVQASEVIIADTSKLYHVVLHRTISLFSVTKASSSVSALPAHS